MNRNSERAILIASLAGAVSDLCVDILMGGPLGRVPESPCADSADVHEKMAAHIAPATQTWPSHDEALELKRIDRHQALMLSVNSMGGDVATEQVVARANAYYEFLQNGGANSKLGDARVPFGSVN